MENEYYVAESFRDLEKVGDVFEKDGKEYINVVLKSGKIHAARVYRPATPKTQTTNRVTHVIYDLYKELGFKPKGYIYIVRTSDEEKLQGICHWHSAFGAYLKCDEDIYDLPFGCEVRKLEWIDVCDRTFIRLLPTTEIKQIIDSLF